MHGVPRAFTRVQGLRGDPLARLIASHGRGTDPYPLMEEIRARGPLLRTPFTWVTVDHGLCREVLRDKCFGVTAPSTMGLPRLLHMLISRTDDPAVANPVEPLAMVVVDPPQHTRYRQLVAQSFTPRAIDALSTRVAEVTNHLIDRLAGIPHPDLIADFATQLPVAIIAEILDLPADTHLHMLEWGHSGAPLLDIGISWRTYRRAIASLRTADHEPRERFRKLRACEAGDNPSVRPEGTGGLSRRGNRAW